MNDDRFYQDPDSSWDKFITHLPLEILAASSVVASLLSFMTGFILDTLNRRFRVLVALNKKMLFAEAVPLLQMNQTSRH